MKYVVHGAPGSGSGIVEAACAEMGVEYEVRDLDARGGEHRGEAYGAINPHRKMPALEVEGGEIITEFSVWLDADWRRQLVPKIEALTVAVLARPALASVWATRSKPGGSLGPRAGAPVRRWSATCPTWGVHLAVLQSPVARTGDRLRGRVRPRRP